jgi:hypothetical protein
MRNKAIASIVVLLALTLGVVKSLRSQSTPAKSSDAQHARNSLAINLLRAINTAEADYKIKHGTYATWESLSASGEFLERGLKWGARNEPQLAGVKFSPAPEILPEWSLRLHVTADGKAYDLLLEDLTDKSCGYAAITDERGVIRQSKAIECEI